MIIYASLLQASQLFTALYIYTNIKYPLKVRLNTFKCSQITGGTNEGLETEGPSHLKEWKRKGKQRKETHHRKDLGIRLTHTADTKLQTDIQ